MKKIMSLLVSLTLFSAVLHAQIQFEQSYNYSAASTELEVDGLKYYLMDVPAEQTRLYNSDFSLWKTLQYSIPNNRWLYDVKYVSQHLFDADDGVESLIIYYQYVETQTSYYYVYALVVVDDNGSELLKVPGGAFADVKSLPDGGSNLFVYNWDYAVWPYTVETLIYRIPGQLVGIQEEIQNTQTVADQTSVFPNPSDGVVKLSLPGQFDYAARLMVRDEKGSLVHEMEIQRQSVEQEINLLHLPAGIYFYHLVSDRLNTKPKKLIIQ